MLDCASSINLEDLLPELNKCAKAFYSKYRTLLCKRIDNDDLYNEGALIFYKCIKGYSCDKGDFKKYYLSSVHNRWKTMLTSVTKNKEYYLKPKNDKVLMSIDEYLRRYTVQSILSRQMIIPDNLPLTEKKLLGILCDGNLGFNVYYKSAKKKNDKVKFTYVLRSFFNISSYKLNRVLENIGNNVEVIGDASEERISQ